MHRLDASRSNFFVVGERAAQSVLPGRVREGNWLSLEIRREHENAKVEPVNEVARTIEYFE